MNRVNFGYSLKNVPIPSKSSYIKSLIAKTDSLIQRMRWKIFQYDKESSNDIQRDNYGFPTEKTPSQHNALISFEADLYDLISNISFSDYRTPFQRKLASDARDLQLLTSIHLLKVKCEKYRQHI